MNKTGNNYRCLREREKVIEVGVITIKCPRTKKNSKRDDAEISQTICVIERRVGKNKKAYHLYNHLLIT